jgi:hypothetical protein
MKTKKGGRNMLQKFTMALEADNLLSSAAEKLREAGFRKQAKELENIRRSLAGETESGQALVYALLRNDRAGSHPGRQV